MSIRCWASPLIFTALLPNIAFGKDGPGPASETPQEKTWTFSSGLGSSKAWNFVGIAKELPVSDHLSIFVTAGLGEMILGAGITLYADRERSGVVASAVAGTGQQLVLTYRWKLGETNYLALGGTYIRQFGFSDYDHPQVLPVLAYEHRF